jgi:Zn-dependent peptidase ImmA (M78 family)
MLNAGKQYYKQMTPREKQMHQEANEFACNLLMPEADFKWFIKNISGDVDLIAKNFGVSPLAVRVRASQLGLKTNKR